MHERQKLDEAQDFLTRMSGESDNRRAFEHDLSAFLSAARSVMQYAEREAKTKSGGKAWYDGRIRSHSLLAYFKDKRDTNIHTEPVRPLARVTKTGTAKASIAVSVSYVARKSDGTVITEGSGTSETQCKGTNGNESKPVVIPTTYHFTDWTGNDDVFSLCRQYLVDLQAVVNDGVQKGFITP